MVPGLITYTRQVLRDDNDKYSAPLPIQRTETKEDEKREEQQEPQRGQDQEDIWPRRRKSEFVTY